MCLFAGKARLIHVYGGFTGVRGPETGACPRLQRSLASVMATQLESFLEAPGYVEYSPWFPNPVVCIRDMALTGAEEVVQRLPLKGLGPWLNDTWYWVSRAQYNDPSAIFIPLLLALCLTILRWTLNSLLFKVSGFKRGVAHASRS